MKNQAQRLIRFAILLAIVVVGAIVARRGGEKGPQPPANPTAEQRVDDELAATLARIDAGERLRFAHDGAVFENRERRLPSKPRGYYREWVHPTPGSDGPGARRVVTGAEGEAWYTPDHYQTFERLR